MREVPPSPPPSDPSDSDSLPSLARNRRIRRQKRNKKKWTSTISSYSDWDDKSKRSIKTKMTILSDRTEVSVISKTTNLSRTKRDKFPALAVIKPALHNFLEALKYKTYPLRKKFQHLYGHAALKVAKLVKHLRVQSKETEFGETDPI